tara:strand:+ start:17734 stop:20061 length:2328 start_codon:yes stop_codon:yes gene_type:complete
MVSSEAWMGSGLSVTMAPESELFLGYGPCGPTLGRENTDKASLIKYSLGYATESATIENGNGEGNAAAKHFTEYYHLVPDLYTGCIAKFYYSDSSADTTAPYSLQFTAIVAGNDADAIYFHGNISDFPTLWTETTPSAARPKGYITLSKQGAIVPAPMDLELRNSVAAGAATAGDGLMAFNTGTDGTVENIQLGDTLYLSDGTEIGQVCSITDSATYVAPHTEPSTTRDADDKYFHFVSTSLGAVDSITAVANGIGSFVMPTSMAGTLTAGDWITSHTGAGNNVGDILGKVLTIDSAGTEVTYIHASGLQTLAATHHIFWGRNAGARISSSSATKTSYYTVRPRILSDEWLGLTNSVTVPNVDIETKAIPMSFGGSRNMTYQYRGMETASEASIDLNMTNGTWLHYAFGQTALTLPSVTGSANNSPFTARASTAATAHETWVAMDGSSGVAGVNSGPFFHRVLRGGTTICPPVMPGKSSKQLANLPSVSSGVAQNTFTYTFTERNDSELPSFALEFVNQKGTKLANAPMVDRNTYNEECYVQVYPGCVMNSFTLTANENEEVKASMGLNVKRVFEAPDGYMGRCYSATETGGTDILDNPTNDFRNLYNFGQLTGNGGTSAAGTIKQEFVTPFFFSDGTVSLFGQNFLKVSSFSLTLNNGVTDKRYLGNYNKQIKMSVSGQRTYEVTMTALVTDRRIFDELRKESSTRSVLTSDSVVELHLTKSDGESIKLQFDDFMVSTNTWPMGEDRGPIYVDFTIIPLKTGTLNATSSSVLTG